MISKNSEGSSSVVRLRLWWRQKFAIFCVALLFGCAATSVFVPYPQQIAPVKSQIGSSQYELALSKLNEHRNSRDALLYLMERGRVAQIAGDRPASMNDFAAAIDIYRANDDKARLTLSGGAAKTAALMTNDNAIPYAGEPFERVFVHHFQALNYLFSGDIEGALVEVRRANLEQQIALTKHDKEIAEAEKKDSQYREQNPGFMDSFRSIEDAAGRVKNSFQNAYTFYVSGVIYEVSRNENDAYIDYKKALEIFPDSIYVQRDVLRLAQKLGMRDDYDRFSKLYPTAARQVGRDSAQIVILFEEGYAPVKREIKVPLFTYNHIHSVAFPTYSEPWYGSVSLRVFDTSKQLDLGRTEPIVYVQALAAKALQERLPAMMVRQILRVIAKSEMVNQSRRAMGDLGGLAATIVNLASENADLRGWLTLPNNAQILREFLPAGPHEFRLESGGVSKVLSVDVAAGKTAVVHVISTGTALHTEVVVL